mmetsp:Transcript_80119/g.166657  ORF Transcript_80119/g.166657 Transcript_80119/m.166657 type:complete len:430 (+) Transcript_80119:1156-2445(+)
MQRTTPTTGILTAINRSPCHIERVLGSGSVSISLSLSLHLHLHRPPSLPTAELYTSQLAISSQSRSSSAACAFGAMMRLQGSVIAFGLALVLASAFDLEVHTLPDDEACDSSASALSLDSDGGALSLRQLRAHATTKTSSSSSESSISKSSKSKSGSKSTRFAAPSSQLVLDNNDDDDEEEAGGSGSGRSSGSGDGADAADVGESFGGSLLVGGSEAGVSSDSLPNELSLVKESSNPVNAGLSLIDARSEQKLTQQQQQQRWWGNWWGPQHWGPPPGWGQPPNDWGAPAPSPWSFEPPAPAPAPAPAGDGIRNYATVTGYHQTSPDICNSILREGFHLGHSGWCGGAIYFALSQAATETKATGVDSHKGCMLQAQVYLGKIKYMGKTCGRVNADQVHSWGFDSIVFDPGDGQELVVYRPSQVSHIKRLW